MRTLSALAAAATLAAPAAAAPVALPLPPLAAPAVAARPIREASAKIVRPDGTLQCYLQGLYLARAGFTEGRFVEIRAVPEGVELRLSEAPTLNRVSGKPLADGERVPVIDTRSALLRLAFGEGADAPASIRVRVEAGRVLLFRGELDQRIAERPTDGTVVDVFAGGGLGTAAAIAAGLTPVAMIELSERYADLAERHVAPATARTGGCTSYVMDAATALFAPLASSEVMTLGLPCEAHSPATRQARKSEAGGVAGQRRTGPKSDHPTGDLAMVAYALIARANPRTVVLECAPSWGASETGVAFRRALGRLGYVVEARKVNLRDHGYLTGRPRTVLVAQTPDRAGRTRDPWPAERAASDGPYPTVAALLDEAHGVAVPESAWFDATTKAWLFAHAERQAEKGNGFAMQVVQPGDATLPTFTKRYLAGRGDNAVLADPTRPGTFRFFSRTELQRIAGCEGLDLGAANTVAGEVIGQGWHVGFFRDLLANVAGPHARPMTHRTPDGTALAESPTPGLPADPTIAGLPLFG